MTKSYTIGNKTYIQKPLVFGQLKQLISLLQGLKIPDALDIFQLIDILDNKIHKAVAIVLTEEGTSLRDKDIEKVEKEIEYEIDINTIAKVIEDFFELTPISSLLERIGGLKDAVVGTRNTAFLPRTQI